MMQAILWKEYREQRSVWVTLAVFGGAGLYGLARLLESDSLMAYHDGLRAPLAGTAVLLAWTYGLVCGAILLAGEREGATLTFLDMLPVRRFQLWLGKCASGLVLFLAQVAVLTGVLIGLDAGEDAWHTAMVVLWMVLAGLVAMSWGLLFSSRGESAIGAIGLAIVGQFAGQFVLGILSVPCMAVMPRLLPESPHAPIVLGCLAGITWAVSPVIGSAYIFSRPDRMRGGEARFLGRPAEVSLWASWGRLLWLSYQQMRRMMWGVLLFSLAMGFLMLLAGPLAWPALTLFLGVLCGVTVFGEEQAFGSFRFLGDQRFPLGRIWVVKVGMRFALAVLAAFVLLLPSVVAAIARMESHPRNEPRPPFFGDVLHSSLVGTVVPTGLYMMMWLLYGFSVGHLCGLLFRKSLIAAVVSLGGSLLLVSLWLPSLLGIGLHFWQIVGVPVIMLVTAWLLMPAWAADRLLARETFVTLGVALTAAGLWTAGGLWYRVAEIPELPDTFDMPAFEASIPPPERNQAGLAIRGAWSEVDHLTYALGKSASEKPLFANDNTNGKATLLSTQVSRVSQRGWPAGPSELGDWLDATFQEKWFQQLAEAADHPLGVVENPKQLQISRHMHLNNWGRAATLCEVLAARGLQQQARGNDKTFVNHLRIGLALSRNLQHLSPAFVARNGRQAERVWMPALDRWLEKLKGHPELLKETLAILVRHEAELPDEADAVKAGYLMALNSLEEMPEELLEIEINHRRAEDDKLRQAEINVAALLWRMPWEHERHLRILRVAFQGDERERRQVREWGGLLLGDLFPGPFGRLHPRSKRAVADLHAAQLKVALRLYQAENGKPATTLDVLVPRYLLAIPLDPFDNQPFRYRLSRGERVGWPPPEVGPGPMAGGMPGGGMPGMPEPAVPAAPLPPPTRFVPKGQGILWSVGEDGQDDGGVQQSARESGTTFGEDILYLVPPPRK